MTEERVMVIISTQKAQIIILFWTLGHAQLVNMWI